MKLVEVAPALRTSQETIDTCVAFAKQLGKTPVVVSDSTGYIVNRLLVPYIVDGIVCLERGLGSIGDIDTAMQNGANHPMGPLALADYIGLDIVFHMASLLQDEYKEARFAPPACSGAWSWPDSSGARAARASTTTSQHAAGAARRRVGRRS